jgi:glycosyltransferase involved in cell wall biosynthesis
VPSVETLSRRQQWLAKTRRPRGDLARGAFERRLREAAKTAEVLHLEETETGWCAYGSALPRVLTVHYLAYKDAALDTLTARQIPSIAEFIYAEALLARRHRCLVASSSYVADGLRRLSPRSDVVVIPLALDPSYYQAAPLEKPPVVGMIGTMTWAPSRAAADHLINRVWPLVVAAVPEARLLVAGRGAVALSKPPGVRGVRIVGEVASANDFLRSLAVLAYPAPARGSGMKVKVLESMATGVPVVTTKRGAEGVGASDGVVVVEEERSVAAAVIDLLRDTDGRRERGAAGRADLSARFSPAVTGAAFGDVYASLTAGA